MAKLAQRIKRKINQLSADRLLFSGTQRDAVDEQIVPLKADQADFLGRFREIVSDPTNFLIEKHPLAGCVQNGNVYLHNGILVPLAGPFAYYGDFSKILVINQGVHEPLEEFVFQEVLKLLPEKPVMLELGAYWGHYSMWCQLRHAEAILFLVEPDPQNIASAKHNFFTNGFSGQFIQEFVGRGHFNVVNFMADRGIPSIDILHCDIQGYELEMLQDALPALNAGQINHVFVSTHSEVLHTECRALLIEADMRIVVASGFERETTSGDGFIYAAKSNLRPELATFQPIGREELAQTKPAAKLRALVQMTEVISARGGDKAAI